MYTIDYFINKFEVMPNDKWTTGRFTSDEGVHCALGHCGVRNYIYPTKEAEALYDIFKSLNITYSRSGIAIEDYTNEKISNKVISISDGITEQYQQPTPKARILAALHDLKAMQQIEEKLDEIVTESNRVQSQQLETV